MDYNYPVNNGTGDIATTYAGTVGKTLDLPVDSATLLELQINGFVNSAEVKGEITINAGSTAAITDVAIELETHVMTFQDNSIVGNYGNSGGEDLGVTRTYGRFAVINRSGSDINLTQSSGDLTVHLSISETSGNGVIVEGEFGADADYLWKADEPLWIEVFNFQAPNAV